MMKKYFLLHLLAFVCLAGPSFSQLKISNPVAQKTPLLQIPVVHITTVESLFVPVHIDMVKPVVVYLDRVVLEKQKQVACDHFKKLKATLVLNGERANDITANLHWETKYAFYAMGFDIERSLGDTLHFLTTDFAAVSNTTNFKIEYHLPDHNDYSDVSYYRIKQHNRDTSFSYSNIVSVKGYEARHLKIYPVPASDNVWIDVSASQTGNITVMVFDLAGKLIRQQSGSCIKNELIVRHIDLTNLAAGLYQVKVMLPDKTFLTGQFIRQ
jgi:hypothetical protein